MFWHSLNILVFLFNKVVNILRNWETIGCTIIMYNMKWPKILFQYVLIWYFYSSLSLIPLLSNIRTYSVSEVPISSPLVTLRSTIFCSLQGLNVMGPPFSHASEAPTCLTFNIISSAFDYKNRQSITLGAAWLVESFKRSQRKPGPIMASYLYLFSLVAIWQVEVKTK